MALWSGHERRAGSAAVRPAGASHNHAFTHLRMQAKPDLTITSPRFCSSILTIYFESNSVVPDAAKTWINAAVNG